MAKQAFVDHPFREATLKKIAQANAIVAEYRTMGFTLTLRQLYYQFVARGYIANNNREYQNLGSAVNNGRLAGLIDWNAIEDRTRNLESKPHWDHPTDIVEACARQFNLDMWIDQKTRVEVWVEKEALIGVVEPTCRKFDIAYFACRGYTSQSEQYGAGMRFREYGKAGQSVLVLHLGDHDPSGIDMTRDNRERLEMFSGLGRGRLEIRRIALNMDQIDRYSPPPNPAKQTDARFQSYSDSYGDESWELDALDPRVIAELISSNVEPLIDRRKWDVRVAEEDVHRRNLMLVSQEWEKIIDRLNEKE